jgi:hypothetical protein
VLPPTGKDKMHHLSYEMTMTSSLHSIPLRHKKDQHYMRGLLVKLMALQGLETDADFRLYLCYHEMNVSNGFLV